MPDNIIETAEITLRDGVSEAELIAASDALQRDFLDGRSGFLRRELLKKDGGGYLDLVHWESREAAEAAMDAAGSSAVCGAFFSIMGAGNDSAGGGVTLFRSLAVYQA